MIGLKGIPLKVDKIGHLGTVNEVIEKLREISEGMENPVLVRLDNDLVVFDCYEPKIEPIKPACMRSFWL